VALTAFSEERLRQAPSNLKATPLKLSRSGRFGKAHSNRPVQVHVTGTRIMVTVILANLAEGLTEAAILNSYPTLKLEDIRAAIHYVSDLASGRVVTLPEAV
jgi:uncharacterized protein (DUF433 family)